MNVVKSIHHWSRETRLDIAVGGYLLVLALLATSAFLLTLANDPDGPDKLATTLVRLNLFSAWFYGLLRASCFHPLLNLRYGRWLHKSPWRATQPLPFGPARLALQDVAFLGLVALTTPGAGFGRLTLLLIAFAAGYGAAVWWSCQTARTWWFAYGFPALIGLLCLLFLDESSRGILLAGVALLALSQVALRQTLFAFERMAPRDLEPAVVVRRSSGENLTAKEIDFAAGSPTTELLSPPAREPKRREALWHASATGALCGWLAFCLIRSFLTLMTYVGGEGVETLPDVVRPLQGVCLFIVIAVGALRLCRYVAWFHPPISLLGRLATGRLIIPGYDIVFVAPLVGVCAAGGISTVLLSHGASLAVSWAVGVGSGVALIRGLPPSFDTWRHTGHHRIHLRNPALMP